MSGIPADEGIKFGAGRRSKSRGGAGDQAEEVNVDSPDVQLSPEVAALPEEKKTHLRNQAIAMLKTVRKGIYDALTSKTSKNVAIAAVTVATVIGALKMAEDSYSDQLCTVQDEARADFIKSFGFAGQAAVCEATKKAYMDTINTIKGVSSPIVAAAVGNVIGLRLSFGEGFVGKMMNTIAEKLGSSVEESAPPQVKGKKGGRTKRRGSNKGRKGGKSRKHRR